MALGNVAIESWSLGTFAGRITQNENDRYTHKGKREYIGYTVGWDKGIGTEELGLGFI